MVKFHANSEDFVHLWFIDISSTYSQKNAIISERIQYIGKIARGQKKKKNRFTPMYNVPVG